MGKNNLPRPKQRKNKNSSALQLSKKDEIYSICVFIALGALIFYPPYVRGLFFNEDFFLYYILTAIVFMLVLIDKISRQDFEFLSTPLDWAVAAYAGAYLLSLIGAIQPGEAVYGFLKALNYFMVYWMVSQMVRSYTSYERLLQILLASGLGVALIGILAATGYCNYPAAFDGKVIMSTLQYRNATAAFLVVTILLGTTLWSKENNRFVKPLYSITNYLIILTVLGTMSKGGWLALALGGILLVIGMPGQYKVKAIYSLAMSGLAAVATAIKFLPAVTGGDTSHALPYLLLGLAVLIGGELFWNFLIFSNRRWGKAVVTGGVILLLLVFVGAGLFGLENGSNIQNKLQSSAITSQAQNIGDLSDFSYTSRLDIYRWGIAIVKDHPFFGTGAGGWNALYHKYQDYLYYTTEVHNHFLQVLIEAGVMGLLAFLSMWVILILNIRKQRKRLIKENTDEGTASDLEHWVLNWGVTVAALTVGAHAFIDFDLSLGALCILLWTLFALINAGTRIELIFPAKTTNIWAFLIIGLVLFIVPLMSGQHMLVANNLYKNASGLFNQTLNMAAGAEKDVHLKNVEAMASEASRTDPYNANYPALLAQTSALQYQALIQQQNGNSAEKMQIIKQAMLAAEAISPYDIKVRNALANTCLIIQDISGAAKQVRFLMEISPLDANTYTAVININVAAADYSLKKNDNKTAIEYLQAAIQCAERMESQKTKIDPQKEQEPFWKGAPFVLNQEAQFNLGKAYYLLGIYSRAQEILQPLIDIQIKPELQVKAWCLAAIEKNGASAEYQQMIQQMQSNDPEAVAEFNKLIQFSPLRKQ